MSKFYAAALLASLTAVCWKLEADFQVTLQRRQKYSPLRSLRIINAFEGPLRSTLRPFKKSVCSKIGWQKNQKRAARYSATRGSLQHYID